MALPSCPQEEEIRADRDREFRKEKRKLGIQKHYVDVSSPIPCTRESKHGAHMYTKDIQSSEKQKDTFRDQ
jgi:hypothetical protein